MRANTTSDTSLFVLGRGLSGTIFPGNQFKLPYALQGNLGVQYEIRTGTVLAVDYVYNHGVGLPFVARDFELRRDATTLNVANAQARINTVTGGLSVAGWLAGKRFALVLGACLVLMTLEAFLFGKGIGQSGTSWV